MSKFIKELLTLRRQATVGPMEYSLRPSDRPDEAPGSVISLARPGQAVAVAVAPRYAREQFENDAKFIVFAYETAAAVIDQVIAAQRLVGQVEYLFAPGTRHLLSREVRDLKAALDRLETFVK